MTKLVLFFASVLLISLSGCSDPVTTYSVTYDGNGNTSGTVPVDPVRYAREQTVVIVGNTGSLLKNGCTYCGWNTSSDGSGITYVAGTTLTILSTDIILYAQWVYNGVGELGPAGGYVFYDKGSYSNGWRYMEAAPYDQSTGIQWTNGGAFTTNTTDTTIGSGQTNTTTIISVQGEGNYAAQICDDLVLNGYSDWFLPSASELFEIQTNLVDHGLGNFTSSNPYWSSSEYSSNKAWTCYFGNGIIEYFKTFLFNVRAIRAY
jgi:hypothetical protein